MVQYVDDGDLACFDGLSFRRDKRTGYFLNAKTHKRLHVYVWEYYNGSEVPKGYHVHHKDFNKKNNEIENLVLMSATEHSKLHGKSWDEERKESARKNLIEKAIPKASEWHGSEDGKKWHSEHAKEVWANMKPNKYVCTYCGKEYETVNIYGKNQNHFCSNNCKSAYRRKMGFDNVTKVCERCGGEYIANKYRKTRFCESCKGSKNRRNQQ